MKIVLASHNQHKLTEMQAFFDNSSVTKAKFIPVSVFDPSFNPDETGTTYVENAIIKAREACRVSGLPSIADDSGIEIEYLNGQPGLDSAYFGDNLKIDFEMTQRYGISGDIILKNRQRFMLRDSLVKACGGDESPARMISTIVFLRHAADPSPIIISSIMPGSVICGKHNCERDGFAFDPVFYPDYEYLQQFESRMHVEYKPLDQFLTHEKNIFSHRGTALQEFARKIKNGEVF